MSDFTCATKRWALPIHSPAVRATTGSLSGPSTTSATTPTMIISLKPKSNMTSHKLKKAAVRAALPRSS